MAMKAYANVEAYLADVPAAPRKHLETVRAAVKKIVPDATEGISYGLPAFKYRARPLLYYGATQKHLALYGGLPAGVDPAIVAKYDMSKGTIRFPLEKPIPAGLVKKIVLARRTEIDAKTGPSKRSATKPTAAAVRKQQTGRAP
jgi:uncharacterized protein YdhG (YjbR/CyaY superfamily)